MKAIRNADGQQTSLKGFPRLQYKDEKSKQEYWAEIQKAILVTSYPARILLMWVSQMFCKVGDGGKVPWLK